MAHRRLPTLLVAALVVAPVVSLGQTPTPHAPVPLVPGKKVVTLWPPGSPTLKNVDQKEVFTMTAGQPQRVQKVVNIHNPSIELHPAAAARANGTGIILAAGGGNTELNVGTEGTDVAAWLNDLGISAFILRYRLQPYSSAVEALADTERAVRVIRANAAEWGVDRAKLGIMGFSAGGEQAARLALNFDAGDPASADPVERESSRPDFTVLVYAGWGRLDMSQVPKNAPPAFLTSAGIDDAFHARQTVEFYNALFNANVPVELHIYGHGGHANGIKPRDGIPFGTWHLRFVEWLTDLQKMR
jgi:endo-1,4-beta-xylanase